MNPLIADWRGKRVWIIGASSGIGAETARELLARGAIVTLSARREVELQQIAFNHSAASIAVCDVTDTERLNAIAEGLFASPDGLDLVLYCAGTYLPMRADSYDLAAMNHALDINLRGVYNMLAPVLPGMLAQGHGSIALIASVIGYSGLPVTLAYGPTKAALINLAESLYFDLHPKGIGVSLINPGFVDTPMTKTNPHPMPALMTPQEAASALIRGLQRGEFHIHFPKRLTHVLRFARLLPYRLYFYIVKAYSKL